MPTTTSSPDTAALQPAAGASVATPWDRLETDIRALKQQALATQKSIQQLQTHEAPDPLQTMQSALPALPGDWDGSVAGVAAGLGLTLVLVWWALWVRPQSRLREAEDYPAPDNSNIARLRRMAQDGAATGHAPLGSTVPTHEGGVSDSLFARHDPNLGFDSEAAASEVMRVRKSLAEKREARSLQREHEDTTLPLTPQVRAWLDPNGPAPLDGVVVNSGPIPIAARAPVPTPPPATEPLPPVIDITSAEPLTDLDLDLGLEPEYEPEPEPEPVPQHLPEQRPSEPAPAPEPVWALDPSLDLELEPTPQPQPEPEATPVAEAQAPAWPDTDFGITLALAQESEALDLWPEARELATEVLESHAPELRDQALALLARLDAREQARSREAALPPDEPTDPSSI